jgi:dUTPase
MRERHICAILTVPLDPFEQKIVDVRMTSNRVGGSGIVSRQGATSIGSAAVAHGYFDVVPKRAKILIANPTNETFVIHAGTRIGSIIPTHLDPDDPLVVGAVCVQRELVGFS